MADGQHQWGHERAAGPACAFRSPSSDLGAARRYRPVGYGTNGMSQVQDTFHPGSRRWFEVAAVVATGLLFLLFRFFRLQGVFVPAAAGFWIVFVWYRARQ